MSLATRLTSLINAIGADVKSLTTQVNNFAANNGRGELGYAQITTTPAAVGNAITDITGLSVTVTVGSRPIWIDFAAELQHTANGEAFIFLHLYEGSTGLQYALDSFAISGRGSTLQKGIRLTPSAGTHTYKLRTQAEANGVQVYAEPSHPAYIRVVEM